MCGPFQRARMSVTMVTPSLYFDTDRFFLNIEWFDHLGWNRSYIFCSYLAVCDVFCFSLHCHPRCSALTTLGSLTWIPSTCPRDTQQTARASTPLLEASVSHESLKAWAFFDVWNEKMTIEVSNWADCSRLSWSRCPVGGSIGLFY